MNRRCELCVFYEKPDGDWKGGSCHRYAPRPGDIVTSRWPQVKSDEWCGEFISDPSLGIHVKKGMR